MGRISELSDEERDIIFGRRLVKSFTGSREETLDFWAREAEYEDLGHVQGEDLGLRGLRRRPQYLDDRDDEWN